MLRGTDHDAHLLFIVVIPLSGLFMFMLNKTAITNWRLHFAFGIVLYWLGSLSICWFGEKETLFGADTGTCALAPLCFSSFYVLVRPTNFQKVLPYKVFSVLLSSKQRRFSGFTLIKTGLVWLRWVFTPQAVVYCY